MRSMARILSYRYAVDRGFARITNFKIAFSILSKLVVSLIEKHCHDLSG